MIEPAPHPQRIHLPPGSIFTGVRAYACDGAVIDALVEGTSEEPIISSCQILELHDLNYGRRRSRHDVGAFLRRCLRRITSDGLVIVLDNQVIPVSADRITSGGVRFHQYCSRTRDEGPFGENHGA